jgi:ABC-2 type transport system ATP-binding protein
VHEPRVLLLDEPAAGLDPQARRDLSTLLVALKDAGMTLVVSSHILAELEDYCSEMIIIEEGVIVGGKAVKVKDVERPRYMLEIAAARSDLRDFLVGRPGVDVIEADEYHALFTHPRNAASRAKLVKAMIAEGFEVSGFGESTKALEDAYFSQVGRAR